MAASLKSDEELVEWFRQRLVWDDPAVVQDLLKKGLFSRIYTPQVDSYASRCSPAFQATEVTVQLRLL